MPCRIRIRRRPGALTLEAALVLPTMVILLFGLIIGGLGVFRYQQVAAQAREAARWASVRGADWRKTTGKTSPTQQQIFDQAVLPLAAGMDPGRLSIDVQWVQIVSGAVAAWDNCSKAPKSLDPVKRVNSNYVTNRVRVTVTYDWTPGLFVTGTLKMQSTCEIPMSF